MTRFSLTTIGALLAFASTIASASPLSARAAKLSIAPAGGNKANWMTVGCAADLYPNGRLFNGGYLENKSGMTIGKVSLCRSISST